MQKENKAPESIVNVDTVHLDFSVGVWLYPDLMMKIHVSTLENQIIFFYLFFFHLFETVFSDASCSAAFCSILCYNSVYISSSGTQRLFISSFCGWTALVSPQHFTAAIVMFLIGAKCSCFQKSTLSISCYISSSFPRYVLCLSNPSAPVCTSYSSLHIIFPCQHQSEQIYAQFSLAEF